MGLFHPGYDLNSPRESEIAIMDDLFPAPEPIPEPPKKPRKPNGGLRAWLQVAGAFFLYLNTWGKFPATSPL